MKEQRKHINLSRIMAFILSIAMLAGFCPPGVSLADIPLTLPKVKAASISNPRIVKDSSMESGQKVTWDCVWFGSYPQSEVTSQDGIYNTLKNATGWDENNDITVDGTKYRRLKGEDATYSARNEDGQYNWNSNYKTYHYFKYEPIKWRVLNRNGEDALLLADVALDDQQYNTNVDVAVTWENSSMRSWLNGYGAANNEPKTDYTSKNFINSAFSQTEKNAIKTTTVINNDNINYGTSGGNTTSDKIFLLSESEVYNTDTAAGYGFAKDYGTYDEARKSRCSTYAYAMGTWRYYDKDEEGYTKYNGNVCWWLRSPGSNSSSAAEVSRCGWVARDGSDVRNCIGGVRPALHLNLASSNLYSYAGTVCSDAMKSGDSGTKPDSVTVKGDKTKAGEMEVKMNGGVNLTLPDDVPAIGGGKIKFDYGNFPIGFWREENEWRIGIGVSDVDKLIEQNGWTTFKQFVNTQKESYKKGINSLLASKYGAASIGMDTDLKISGYGYAEGTITKSGNVQSMGGKLVIEIKGTAEKQWQTLLVVVPVVIKIKGEAGIETTLSLGFDFKNSSLYTTGKAEMTLPKVRLTSGVGVAYVVDVSVYGEAKNTLTIESENNNSNVTGSVKGALGASAKALCFSYEQEFLNGSKDYLSTKNKSKSKMYSTPSITKELKAKDYEIHRVHSTWNKSVAAQKGRVRSKTNNTDSESIKTLQSDIYANAKPQLLQTQSGKKVLVYTTDIEDRTTGNHTAAVYSIYNEEEKTWSTPTVIEDDGTADFDAVASVDGEDVYIAWVNANRTFTEEEATADDFMTTLASSTEIRAAKVTVDGNTGNVTMYPDITNNTVSDLYPSITVQDHTPYIAWNSNSENDILKGTGTNSIYLASVNENEVTINKLANETKPVQSVAIGILGGNLETAYTINSGTEGKPQTELIVADKDDRYVLAENGQNLSPSFANINGDLVLIWYAQNENATSLNYISSIDGDVGSYINEDAAIFTDYTVIEDDENSLILCTADKENSEKAGRDIFAYVIKDGKTSQAVQLTDLDGYVAVPSGIWNGSSYEYLFTRSDVTIEDDNVQEQSDLCIASTTPTSTLAIGEIDYAQEQLMPENDTEITIPVKNNGLSECKDGKVQITCNGEVIGQATIEDKLAAGEEKDIPISLTVPEDTTAKETLKVETMSDGNEEADSTKDIASAGSELTLSTEQKEEEVVVTVENISSFDTETTLELKADNSLGETLKTINLGNIQAHDTLEYTLDKTELTELGSDTIYMEVCGDTEESVKTDNEAYIYVGDSQLKTLDYITATKEKTIYKRGEEVSLDDLEVTAVYTDGSKEKVTDFTTNVAEMDTSVLGEKQLKILYEEVGIGRKVDIPITVEEQEPDKPSEPDKPTEPDKPSKPSNPGTTRVVKVSSIRLSGISKQIAAGKKIALKASVLPANSSNKKLTWKSSNTKVATVSQSGVVTLKKNSGGKKVTITATAQDGSKKFASWKITSMRGIVKSVKVSGAKSVKAGKTLKLKAKVSATKKANTKLKWSSSNTKIATVSQKGVVKAGKAAKGKTVKITAMTTDGSNKKSTIKIKIK